MHSLNTKYSLEINKEDIGRINAFFIGKIIELDDKCIVIHRTMNPLSKFFSYLIVFFMVGFGVGLTTLIVWFWLSSHIHWAFVLLVSLFSLFIVTIGVALGIQISLTKKQYIIFDREHSTITHPRNKLSIKHVTYPYKDIHLHSFYRMASDNISYVGSARVEPWYNYIGVQMHDNNKFVRFMYGNGGIYLVKWSSVKNKNRYIDFWDYMKHYMTRGRPLPPGTAFDPYR